MDIVTWTDMCVCMCACMHVCESQYVFGVGWVGGCLVLVCVPL